MLLRKLTLRHFRNVGFATLEFAGRQQFLVGANGQGKTNLLEAAGFITALRSFRTTDSRLLISHGQHTGAIGCSLEHERFRETALTIKVRHDGKEVWHDQERLTKLGEFIGRFPTVVFSSQDLQFVRGTPVQRRRWLDGTFAAMDADYLRALQVYARALAARNALLRSGGGTAVEFTAFEQQMAPAGAWLIAARRAGLEELALQIRALYAKLCDESEPAGLEYVPNFGEASAEALLARLESGRERDRQMRSTLAGPHRDDFQFTVRHTAARDFASEGQQRSLVLALRLAQAAWFHERSGVRPVLLADDVLGELDPGRRRRFWAAVDPDSQVIATGTHLPDAELGAWQVFEVSEGQFKEIA